MIARIVLLILCTVSLYPCETTLETNDALLFHFLKNHTVHTHRQSWRPIQEEVADTVVQIVAHFAEIDLLQPFKTPTQYSVRGSGFFIDERGTIITNAHVVKNAISVWIHIPSLGKQPIDATVISICPERDIALLRVTPEEMSMLRAALGIIPYLTLGDSDQVYRADDVLALGYPLGQESLKSTTGVISGRENNMIQISAPINPGSSGGPLLNTRGEVIGINSSGVTEAQNVGYIIPINELKVILPDLMSAELPLLRKPHIGIVQQNATETLRTYLDNPEPGGSLVIEVIKNSPAYKAGVQRGDMIYEVNGYPVDIFGDMRVPWCEDKISIDSFVSRLANGEVVDMLVYRNGQAHQLNVRIDYTELLPIRKIYPLYEPVEYEIFGGCVVMPLTVNHIKILGNFAPGLVQYVEAKHQTEPALIITHIFPMSQLYKTRTTAPGFILTEVNGQPVHTLDEFRRAILHHKKSDYCTFKATDTISNSSDNIFVVLSLPHILKEEPILANAFHYPMSDLVSAVQG